MREVRVEISKLEIPMPEEALEVTLDDHLVKNPKGMTVLQAYKLNRG